MISERIVNRQPLKRQFHKMVKQTQAIYRQQPTNRLNVFDHFVKLALKGLIIFQIIPKQD